MTSFLFRRAAALAAALVLVVSGTAVADLGASRLVARTPDPPSSITPDGHEPLVGRLTATPSPVLLGKRAGDRVYQPSPVAGVLSTVDGGVDSALWLVTPGERGAVSSAMRAERGRAPPARSS